jgi:hypothetical protein
MAHQERTPYVHVTVRVLDGRRLWVILDVRAYTADEANLRCSWNPCHAVAGRHMLFRNGNDIRCFKCVPWGNVVLRREFVRIGLY